MKGWRPWLAATVITTIVACGMLVIGLAAALNPRGVAPSDSPSLTATGATVSGDPAAQVAQLQSLVAQYQAREQQYQSQLAAAQQAVQGYQQVLIALQQSGVIRITSDGQILLRGGG